MQQSQAAKYGIPPTGNIVSGQNTSEAYGAGAGLGAPGSGGVGGGTGYGSGAVGGGPGVPGVSQAPTGRAGGICTSEGRAALGRQVEATCDPIFDRMLKRKKQLMKESNDRCVGGSSPCAKQYDQQIRQIQDQAKRDIEACT